MARNPAMMVAVVAPDAAWKGNECRDSPLPGTELTGPCLTVIRRSDIRLMAGVTYVLPDRQNRETGLPSPAVRSQHYRMAACQRKPLTPWPCRPEAVDSVGAGSECEFSPDGDAF